MGPHGAVGGREANRALQQPDARYPCLAGLPLISVQRPAGKAFLN